MSPVRAPHAQPEIHGRASPARVTMQPRGMGESCSQDDDKAKLTERDEHGMRITIPTISVPLRSRHHALSCHIERDDEARGSIDGWALYMMPP